MYSATITKSEHLTLSTPKDSNRLKVGFYSITNKFFLYVGFDTQEAANKSRDWLISKGHSKAYNYKTDSGVNKPRKSEHSNQAWELKIHRATTELVDLFVQAEIKRKAKVEAVEVVEVEEWRDYSQAQMDSLDRNWESRY